MISFQNLSISFKLQNKQHIKNWIKSVAEKEKKQVGNINYIFCNDEELLDVNIKHLNHDTYTDIITFDYSEAKKIHGDIFISVERVLENSSKFKTTFDNELSRVMIHGILHLCGYKDKSKKDAELMREKENSYIKLKQKLSKVS